jgi:hypothetical protein
MKNALRHEKCSALKDFEKSRTRLDKEIPFNAKKSRARNQLTRFRFSLQRHRRVLIVGFENGGSADDYFESDF